MSDRIALITGISGQDGSYLAELLLGRGYSVVGLTRDPAAHLGPNLSHLAGRIRLISTSYDRAALNDIIRAIRPHEIFNCAGQTYVSKSWGMIDETWQASALLPCDLLEAIIRVDKGIRFFQASSCEIFSLDSCGPYTELTPIAPGNPYGCSKAFAHNMIACYRNNYGVFAASGILFNHESPRRHVTFVSRKIVKAAVAIKLGRANELAIGNLDVVRDWSYAPDVTVAMAAMLQSDQPEDLLVCSGESHALREFVEAAFSRLDLDYMRYVRVDSSLLRVAEPSSIRGSNSRAKLALGWAPKISFHGMVDKMVDYEIRLQTGTELNFAGEGAFL
jgi:GDPmannose 4,6-dehydratase